jgi:Nuclease-related domain
MDVVAGAASQAHANEQGETPMEPGAAHRAGATRAILDALSDKGIGSLHDRLIPGRRSRFDHLVVGPSGVFVIDEKHSESSRPTDLSTQQVGGMIDEERTQLLVDGRPRDTLVDWLESRAAVVKDALRSAGIKDVDVVPVLCFAGGSLPALHRRLRVGETTVVSQSGLPRVLRARGELTLARQHEVLQRLADSFPEAS